MLKRFRNYFSTAKTGSSDKTQANPKSIPQNIHNIRKNRISRNAIKVAKELREQGWQAYLVGGCIRDLLLGLEPKDFDVATDATPEQVQGAFRRARIIGRRFKIVHVRMGPEMLEVTTFRGAHHDSHKKQNKLSQQSDSGVLLRDNVYGDLKSDAYRRDFTINALYYDPSSEEIIDYTGALDDLKNKRLRIIGNAVERYKEDPVRMIRAVRFQCKLELTIDSASQAAILAHANYLREIPPARLFDEVLKLFLNGKAETTLFKLHDYGLLQHLLPSVAQTLDAETDQQQKMLIQAAKNTDDRIATGKRVTPAFIYAVFLWPVVQKEMARLKAESRRSTQEYLHDAAHGAIFAQQQYTTIPKRFQMAMREIWTLQFRFEKRDPKRAYALLEHPRFRAAYDFMLLRESSGEHVNNLGEWWTRFQFATPEDQATMISEIKRPAKKRPRRRKSATREASNND